MIKKIDWHEDCWAHGFPCKDCPRRHPACHDTCEEYREAHNANWHRTHNCSEIANYSSDKAKQVRDDAAKYAKKNKGRSKAGYD